MDIHNAITVDEQCDSDRPLRYFTIEEANRALPLVQRVVMDIVRQHRRISSLEETRLVPRDDLSEESLTEIRDRYARELRRLNDLVEELQDIGCKLKDWRHGLVDFPSRRGTREIELCWRLGEPDVHHWHEPGAGYRSRRPLRIEASADLSS